MKMDIGGAETHILELCEALVSRKHSVTVTSAGGRFVRELQKLGVEHVTLPLDKKSPFAVMFSRHELKRLIEDEKFDIVHAHARIPAFVLAPVCRRLDVRFVTTAHGMFSVSPILKKLTRWGEHTFSVSEDISRYLRNNYRIESRNITFVPNGIDRKKFERDDDLGAGVRRSVGARGKKIILHVSRLDRASSLCAAELIYAVDELSKTRDDLVLVLVGGGNNFSEIADIASKVNSRRGRRVVYLAGAALDVRPYLSAADVFVGPSRSALEAMATGIPVVISGSEGHLGELTRSNFGFALSTNLCCRSAELPDHKTLSKCISDMLLKDKKELAELISLQNELLDNYSVGRMTDIYERVYRRLSIIKINKKPDAVICGYYGFWNAGDRAMLYSLVGGIRSERGDASLCVMSSCPKKTSEEYVVSSVYRYNIFAVRRQIMRAGVLVFGGGNLLQDQTSRRSLLYYTYILKTAKKLGARIIIYANGIGPLRRESVDYVTALLKDADYVSMRDEESFEFCRKYGIDAHLSADPAFTLETGVPPMARGGYFAVVPKKTTGDEYLSLCELMRWVSEKYSLRPLVISMYPSQDGAFAKTLAKATDALIINEGITDFGILQSAMSGAEFSIGQRLHSLVCASVSGCPMISVGDGKNAAFMKGMRLEYCSVLSYGKARSAVDDLMKSSEQIRRTILNSASRMRTLAENDISNVVEEIWKQ